MSLGRVFRTLTPMHYIVAAGCVLCAFPCLFSATQRRSLPPNADGLSLLVHVAYISVQQEYCVEPRKASAFQTRDACNTNAASAPQPNISVCNSARESAIN